ncbi:unnamed protein product, partial [Ixodes persulcatus]
MTHYQHTTLHKTVLQEKRKKLRAFFFKGSWTCKEYFPTRVYFTRLNCTVGNMTEYFCMRETSRPDVCLRDSCPFCVRSLKNCTSTIFHLGRTKSPRYQ